MIHLNFILYLLSFAAAAASITGAVLFYFHYKKIVLLYYSLILMVPTILLLHRMSEIYCGVMIHQKSFLLMISLTTLEKIAFSLGMFTGPFFLHQLLGLPLSRLTKTLYIVIACIYTLLAFGEIVTLHYSITFLFRNILSMPLLFGMYGYCLVIAALNLGKLGNPLLKKVVMAFFGISVMIFPFSVIQYFTQKPLLPGFMERPILFICLFVCTILFTVKYFNRPAYFDDKNLTGYFKDTFAITNRESEIVQLVLQGHSNQLIGEKLFISTRTVESHLYSIFQKLGVKNRIQLANLIQTNKK